MIFGRDMNQITEFKLNHIYESKRGEKYVYVGKYKFYDYVYSDKSVFYFFDNFLKKHKDENIHPYGLDSEKKAVVTYEKGLYYFFARYKDDGQIYTDYLRRYKNPKEMFIRELGIYDNEEGLKKLEKYILFNTHIHRIDYSKQYKWNFSEQDFYNLYTSKIEKDYLSEYDTIGVRMYIGKASSIYKFVYLKYMIDENGIFKGEYILHGFSGAHEHHEITSLTSFIEKYKPFCFYNFTDNGKIYTEDYQLKSFFNAEFL